MSISLFHIFLGSVAFYALFKFGFLPSAKKRIASDRSAAVLGAYFWRNTVSFGCLFFLLNAISSGVCLMLLMLAKSVGGVDYQSLNEALAWVSSVEDVASKFSSGWGIAGTILLVVALIIVSRRAATNHVEGKLKQSFELELERLQNEHDSGNWEELPPTEEMEQLIEVLALIDEEESKLRSEEGAVHSEQVFSDLESKRREVFEVLENLDLKRRINLSVEPEEGNERRSFMGRVLVFFSSEGLLKTLSGGGAILAVLCSLLLVPSLLSVNFGVLQEKIVSERERLRGSLEEVELAYQREEVASAFSLEIDLESDEGDDEEWTDEDENVVNELSRLFENQIVEARFTGSLPDDGGSTQALSRFAVRSSILDDYTARSRSVRVSKVGELPELLKEGVAFERSASHGRKPTTSLGRTFHDDFRTAIRKNPGFRAHCRTLVNSATQSFKIPASPRSIKGMMLSNAVGHIAQSVEVPGMAGRITSALGDISSGTMHDFYTTESRRFMVELSRSDTLSEAVDSMAKTKYRPIHRKGMDTVRSVLSSFPDEASVKSAVNARQVAVRSVPEAHVDYASAQRRATGLARSSGRLSSATFADSLTSFGDYFPGVMGEEGSTPRGKTLRASPEMPRASVSRAASRASFSRARSYTRLRGFSRIGGVLIGRLPEGDGQLEVVDLEWSIVGEDVLITLTFEDGKQHTLGPYNPAIVSQALAYAADGRPVTVTMVSSEPLPDLRILLHPILEDTALGCRSIRLDQVVDEVTSGDEALQQNRYLENMRIHKAHQIYVYAWAQRIRNAGFAHPEFRSEVPEYVDMARQVLENLKEQVSDSLRSGEYSLEFLREKTDFYDPEIIRAIANYRPIIDFSKYLSTVLDDPMRRDDVSWLESPPETTEWSGVRERPYRIDRSLSFLETEGKDSLWPLRFMVQRVFVSEPVFVSNSSTYAGDDPWEFESVMLPLREKIQEYCTGDQELANVIDDMREFAILQRLFRVALEGRFGDRFPLGKLASLNLDTRSFVEDGPRTLRWLPKPQMIEYTVRDQASADDSESVIRIRIKEVEELRNDLGIQVDELQALSSSGVCERP